MSKQVSTECKTFTDKKLLKKTVKSMFKGSSAKSGTLCNYWGNSVKQADILINDRAGFYKSGEKYKFECTVDHQSVLALFDSVKAKSEKDFVDIISTEYAKVAVMDTLRKSGVKITETKKNKDRSIEISVRV